MSQREISVAETIRARLTEALTPTALDVVDESHKHKGHMGARPEGETHFRVAVTAAAFDGVARLQRQRLVLDALSDLMDNPIHALSIQAKTPEEAARG
jgi:BolA protein